MPSRSALATNQAAVCQPAPGHPDRLARGARRVDRQLVAQHARSPRRWSRPSSAWRTCTRSRRLAAQERVGERRAPPPRAWRRRCRRPRSARPGSRRPAASVCQCGTLTSAARNSRVASVTSVSSLARCRAPALRRALLQDADRVAVAGSRSEVAQLALLQPGGEREHAGALGQRRAVLRDRADHLRGDRGLVGVDLVGRRRAVRGREVRLDRADDAPARRTHPRRPTSDDRDERDRQSGAACGHAAQTLACSASFSATPLPVRGRASRAPVTLLRQNSSPDWPDSVDGLDACRVRAR